MTTAGGGAAIGAVEVDSRNVDLALSHHSRPPPSGRCAPCSPTTPQTAIGNLPTPDTQLTDDLNAAYEDAAAAGDDCYNGASGNQAPAAALGLGAGQAGAAADRRRRPDRGHHRAHPVHLHHRTGPSDATIDPFGDRVHRSSRMPLADGSGPSRRTATPTSTTGSAAGCCGRCPPASSWSAAGPATGAT